jgi:hypothetical protein
MPHPTEPGPSLVSPSIEPPRSISNCRFAAVHFHYSLTGIFIPRLHVHAGILSC